MVRVDSLIYLDPNATTLLGFDRKHYRVHTHLTISTTLNVPIPQMLSSTNGYIDRVGSTLLLSTNMIIGRSTIYSSMNMQREGSFRLSLVRPRLLMRVSCHR